MTKRLLLTLACVIVASIAEAQTPPTLIFTASPDHDAVVGTTAILTGYQIDVMVDTVDGALAFTRSLGKPTPDAAREIRVPLPEFLTRPNGVYVIRATAQGPGGTAASLPSDPFAWIGLPPARPGKPSIQLGAPSAN